MAVGRSSISTLRISSEAVKKTIPFITNKNKPKLIKMMGAAIRIKKGRKPQFKTDITATMDNEVNQLPFILIPGIKVVVK